MIDVNNLINKLNSEQVKPVLDTEGAVLVIAGAGSGKTRVLTTRIAYLVSEKKVPADRILAITFTNKAAGEMKERLTKILGDIPQMWVCTIHSMCVRILRALIEKIKDSIKIPLAHVALFYYCITKFRILQVFAYN